MSPGTRVAGLLLLLSGLTAVARASEFTGQRTFGAATTRGAYLARGMGARPAALGSAFTAVSDDASAMAWNPAGLGQMSSLSVVAQHDLATEGISISSLSAAMPLGESVAAFSVAMVSYGTLEYRDATGAPAGEGSLTDGAATQGWGFRNPAWLGGLGWSGVAVEVVQEAWATALLGVSAGTLVPLDGGWTFGASVLHLGPRVDGMSLPRAFRLGSAYHTGPVNGVVDLSYGLADHLMTLGAGVEWRPLPWAFARAGWRQEGRGQGLAGSRGVTAGFGARFERIGVDYAYQPFGDLATMHRISLEYRLPGGPRPARVPPPVVTKPLPPKRREPVVKVMPAAGGAEIEGISLKPGTGTPLRTGAISATTHATAGAVHIAPPSSATPAVEPDAGNGPAVDPLLPPPTELETPPDADEGLRGGGRRGGSRPGADGSPDAPLRGGR